MTLNKIIATLQSNIARRGIELADLETVYSIRRATAYTKHQYRVIRAIRQEIAPMAQQQKLERIILRELTNQRTIRQQQSNIPFFVLEAMYPPTYGLTQSNKFSF